MIDEDGIEKQNLALAGELLQAAFVSLKDWQRLVRDALRSRP